MGTILKCKMCGGDIEVSKDMTVGTCLYCGLTITLPRIDNDKKARLFNRADQYRLNNQFDKTYDAHKAIEQERNKEEVIEFKDSLSVLCVYFCLQYGKTGFTFPKS